MSEFRQALIDLDIPRLQGLWAKSGFPQPMNPLATAHRARTEAVSIPLRHRAYSHRWLEDHGLPSGLPDHLKPRVDRLYPVVVEAVGISVNGFGMFSDIIPFVQRSMEDAVSECFADGHKETAIVKPRMFEAKARTVKQLIGI